MKGTHSRRIRLAVIFTMAVLAGCKSEPKDKAIPEAPVEEGQKVVEVSTKSMEFFAPDREGPKRPGGASESCRSGSPR